jgi:hypothetical protein
MLINTSPNQNKLLEQFDNFAPDYRKALAQKLKAAGYYRGDVTGKPSLKLQEAYFKAYEDLDFSNRQRLTTYAGDPNQAYNVQLDYDWYFRPGIEVGFGSKSFGFQNLVLGDQINIGNETINPISISICIILISYTFFLPS